MHSFPGTVSYSTLFAAPHTVLIQVDRFQPSKNRTFGSDQYVYMNSGVRFMAYPVRPSEVLPTHMLGPDSCVFVWCLSGLVSINLSHMVGILRALAESNVSFQQKRTASFLDQLCNFQMGDVGIGLFWGRGAVLPAHVHLGGRWTAKFGWRTAKFGRGGGQLSSSCPLFPVCTGPGALLKKI